MSTGPAARAALPGSGAGILVALSAALIKATVSRLDDGLVAVVLDWHLWALVSVAIVATGLVQASLAADRLGAALATQLGVDAMVAVLLGVLVFGEHLNGRLARGVVGLAGIALAVAGVGWLTAAGARDQRRRASRNAAVTAASSMIAGRQCATRAGYLNGTVTGPRVLVKTAMKSRSSGVK